MQPQRLAISTANTARKTTLNAAFVNERCNVIALVNLPIFQSTVSLPLCWMVGGIVWYFKCINVLYIGVNVAWKPTPLVCLRCVNLVVTWSLMSGCLFVRRVMHLMCSCNLSIKIILFSVFFVLLSEKQRFLLLKVTTFIIPAVHSSSYQSSVELHVRGFQRFSPFMVIVAEFLGPNSTFQSPVWNTQLSE